MSVSRIAKLGAVCGTSEGRFQAAQLEDGSYRLLIGEFALKVRDVLPIDPGEGRAIEEFSDRAAFQEALEQWVDALEDNNDDESAERMRAAWAEFCA